MIENFPANEFTVGASGDYPTITQALTAVAAMSPVPSSQNPYRLIILPGTYNETVTMIPYVQLFGYNAERTIITSSGPSPVVTGCSNASLDGLTIQCTGGPTFKASGASNLLLHNVTFASGWEKNVVLSGPGGPVRFEDSRIVTLFASLTYQSNVVAMHAENTSFSLVDSRISIATACLPNVFSIGLHMIGASGEVFRGGVTSLAAVMPWGNLSIWGEGTCSLKVSDAQIGGAAAWASGNLLNVNIYDVNFNPISSVSSASPATLRKLQGKERQMS